MKKTLVLLLCLLFSLMFSCTKACQKNKTQTPVLRIGTNANFPPYESINQKGELIGFDIDVGRALVKELKMEAQFKEYDFDGLLLALDKEQIDVILSGMSITSSRQAEIAMVPYQGEPLTEISFMFWQHVPEGVHNIADLKVLSQKENLAVSVQAGHFLESYLKEEGINVKTLAGPPEQVLDIKYKKSLSAAVDKIVADKLTAEHHGLKKLTFPLPKDKWDLGYGIGIKKTRQDLIKQVQNAVDKMQEQGVLGEMRKKWFKDGPNDE